MELISSDFRLEVGTRIEKIRSRMYDGAVDALLLASNSNIYYATGRIFRGYVYIPAEGPALWFVVRPDVFGHDPGVVMIHKPELIPGELEKRGMKLPESVGLEFDSLSYSDVARLQRVFKSSETVNASPLMRRVRMQKTPMEIEFMRQDGIHQAEAYRRFSRCYKEDMTDVQFQVEIERILRLEGALGFIRTSGNLMDINLGSVIAGPNADTPSPYDFAMGGAGIDPALPGGANGTMLKPGQTVMVDMSGAFNGYQTDMTRVWRIGEIPEIANKAHECSRSILRLCERIGKPGVPVADLYNRALEMAENDGLADYFMGHRQKAPFIGHGIGIELNESPAVSPKSKDLLLENMTIALEPKFVIPEVGAVGVENTYVVTPGGLSLLTVFPEEIQEL